MSIDELVGALARGTSPAVGIVTGTLAAILPDGTARVPLTGRPAEPACVARSIVPLTAADVGREVLLAFVNGDAAQAVVLGVLQGQRDAEPVQVEADGKTVVVRGEDELVLKCGKASITLTRAGKILIRGTYVLSRSSGVNRIKGGSVQIN